MDASYIIVNWNTRELTAQAVASILAFEREARYEIIVVDNGSSDGSVGFLRGKFPDITVIANPINAGFARANNLGAAAARGKWLVLFNSDAYQTEPTLTPLLKITESLGKPCLIACRLRYPDGSPQLAASPFPSLAGYMRESFASTATAHARLLAAQDSLPSPAGRVDWVSAAFLMAPREEYLALKGLDESIFMYAEDVDFCRKAAVAGLPCYLTRAVSIVHIGGGSVDHLSAKALRLTDEGRLVYFRKWHGPAAAFLLRAVFAFRSIARAAFFGIKGITSGDAVARAKAMVHLQGLIYLLAGK